MKRFVFAAAAAALLMGFAGCANNADSSSNTPASVAVTGITVTSAGNATTMTTNGTLQLTAAVMPDNATNKTVTWTSSAEDIATVDTAGLVTAKKASTTAVTITATANDGSGKTGTFDITVSDAAAGGTSLSFTALSLADTTYATATAQTDEAGAKSNPGKIALWYDQNWCGSKVTAGSVTGTDAALSLDYTVTGACEYGVQLFDALNTDGTYLVNYTVKSATAQKVKCNGNMYALEAGVEKEISAIVTVSGATTAVSIQVPVDATNISASNTFTLSNVKYTAIDETKFTVSALTMSSDTAAIAAGDTTDLTVTGTYTFTDTDSHVYTIYKAVAAADLTWTSDAESVATVSAGTVTGAAAGNATITAASGTVTTTCAVTVSAAKDYGKYFSTTSNANGADVSVTVPGYLCLWCDKAWCGSTVTLSAVSASETSYSLARTVSGSCWFGTQMFYAADAGSYTVSFKVKSSVAGDITVNGTVYTLAADTEKAISYDITETAVANIIRIQLGNESATTQLGDGTFTISEFSVTTK